jgi:hypothetical protein
MSGEFWAAIIGAIVGALAGGGITAALQNWQFGREKRDRDRGLAQSLLFKLMRIHSDLEGFRQHVAESDLRAQNAGLEVGWQSMRPIGNGPPKVSFASDEMAFLLSLRNLPLFNSILSLDAIQGSTIDIFVLYAAQRTALTSILPAQMDGMIGHIDLNEDEYRRFAPAAAALNDIVASIRAHAARDAELAWEAVTALSAAIEPVLGHRVEVVLKSENE